MGKLKKVVSFTSMAILLMNFNQPVRAANYVDMRGHWSSDYVYTLSEDNIMNGYDDGTFKPNNNVTRAEFYSTINNLAGLRKTYSVTFNDVSKSDWFYEEVAKGIKAGYIKPTTGNLYPEQQISRQEAMHIIGYMYDLTPNKRAVDEKGFSDANLIREDAKGYIGALISQGIVEGYENGNFQPNNPITRGETSKIIDTLIKALGKPDEKVVLDSDIKFESKNYYK